MSDYRRAYVPGGCYFFTVVTHRRQPVFADDRNVERLREGFRRIMDKRPFRIDAIVILPDHVHTVWRLPDGDADFSLRWRLIKHDLASGIAVGANRRGEKAVWQRRFWEHLIRGEDDWRNHVDYVHYNPVKHGYVKRPGVWPWSSFGQARRREWYPPGWGIWSRRTCGGWVSSEGGGWWNRCACSTLPVGLELAAKCTRCQAHPLDDSAGDT